MAFFTMKKPKLSENLHVDKDGKLVLSLFGEDFKVNGIRKSHNSFNFIQINSKKYKNY